MNDCLVLLLNKVISQWLSHLKVTWETWLVTPVTKINIFLQSCLIKNVELVFLSKINLAWLVKCPIGHLVILTGLDIDRETIATFFSWSLKILQFGSRMRFKKIKERSNNPIQVFDPKFCLIKFYKKGFCFSFIKFQLNKLSLSSSSLDSNVLQIHLNSHHKMN